MDPFLQLDVIGCNKSLFPVRENFNTELGLAPHQDVGRFGKASHPRFTNQFTLNVIAVGGIDKHFDVDSDAGGGFQQDNLGIGQVFGSLASLLGIKDLGRNIFVVQQPAHGINLMDDGIGNGHVSGVIVDDRRIAMGAMGDQRSANPPLGDNLFQKAIASIIATHETDLDQALAQVDFGIKDAFAGGGGG